MSTSVLTFFSLAVETELFFKVETFLFPLAGAEELFVSFMIIRENVFCLGGNRDHVPACLCHMLYCIARSEEYNLAFFVAKRMEFFTKQARLLLPYGMLLTHLFDHVMFENPELSNDSYILYDRVMYPLTAQQERKTRKDYGTKRGRPSTSTSFSSAFGQPSSSYHIDDDNDENNEGTSRASTPSPTRFVNSLSNDIPQVFSNPPHIDQNIEAFYTRQIEILNVKSNCEMSNRVA
ncbi:hypothetical protein Tco_0552248 [Tanacetum coccineum]